jgi:hypothetical protein
MQCDCDGVEIVVEKVAMCRYVSRVTFADLCPSIL